MEGPWERFRGKKIPKTPKKFFPPQIWTPKMAPSNSQKHQAKSKTTFQKKPFLKSFY